MTGPNGLLKLFTKNVLETALNEELTEHLGHPKRRADPGRESTNIRNGSRSKTVISDAAGEVVIDVPRDREGTPSSFPPVPPLRVRDDLLVLSNQPQEGQGAALLGSRPASGQRTASETPAGPPRPHPRQTRSNQEPETSVQSAIRDR